MMHSRQYHADCNQLVGVVVDHNSGMLAKALEKARGHAQPEHVSYG
jgi:hypothetical protein